MPPHNKTIENKRQRSEKSTQRNVLTNRLQDYRKYSTNPADFQTWLDRIYSKINLSIPVVSALLGVFVYFIGLSIAATFDFGKEYINTSAIYIGVFGISLVSGVVRFASLRIHSVFESFRPCFMVDDDTYFSFIKRWFSKLSNDTGNLVIAGNYIVLALLVAYSEFFLSPLTGRVQYGALKAYFFEPFWYQPEYLWGKAIIIAFYGICVALPLGIATRLLYLNYEFMKDVRNLPVIPLIKTIRIRFREIVDYYLYIIFTWSIGISLFGIAFFNGLNIDSIIFLSALNILGIGTFIAPQLCYRNYVLQSATILTRQTLTTFYSDMGIKLHERPISQLGTSKRLQLNSATESLEGSINWWVYDLPDLIIFILAQAVIYGLTFLQS